jgi:hypothetical protein
MPASRFSREMDAVRTRGLRSRHRWGGEGQRFLKGLSQANVQLLRFLSSGCLQRNGQEIVYTREKKERRGDWGLGTTTQTLKAVKRQPYTASCLA